MNLTTMINGSTLFWLMAEFGQAAPPLAKVAEKYLGMKPKKADDLARCNLLPIPTFRIGGQKSPRLVRIEDLARVIDERYAAARAEHERGR